MKKTIALILLTISSSTTFAASAEVIKAALDSDYAKEVPVINSIEVINTYRCIDCYDIEISGTDMSGQAHVVVRTERSSDKKIRVYYVRGSR